MGSALRWKAEYGGVLHQVTHDYVRARTTTPFAALEPATGKVKGSRHRSTEFTNFLADSTGQPRHSCMFIRCWTTTRLTNPAIGLAAGPPALHTHRIVLAQPRRAVVRRAGQRTSPARRSQNPGVAHYHGNTNPQPSIRTNRRRDRRTPRHGSEQDSRLSRPDRQHLAQGKPGSRGRPGAAVSSHGGLRCATARPGRANRVRGLLRARVPQR